MGNDIKQDLARIQVKIDNTTTNIKMFEDAIEQEHTRIKEYRQMLIDADSGYSEEGLRNGIAQSKQHILVFEQAIDKERETAKDLVYMANHLQRMATLAHSPIVLEVVPEDADIS